MRERERERERDRKRVKERERKIERCKNFFKEGKSRENQHKRKDEA